MSLRRPLRTDRRGMVAVEFALVFPLLILVSVSVIEFALMMLMDASLELGIREASRAGSLTSSGSEAERRTRVEQIIASVAGRWVPGTSTIDIATRVYPRLNAIGQPTFVDTNGNGVCDAAEGTCRPNSVPVVAGVGIAGSLVSYTVTLRRPGFTGVLRLVGIDQLEFVRTTFVLNQ